MYNNYPATGSSFNNPFASDPTNAQARYPDISSPMTQASPQQQWPQQNQYYPQQDQQQFQPQQTQSQFFQQQPQYQQPQPTGYPSGQGFQPTSFFGQQLAGAANQQLGSSYGYLNGQSTPQSPSAYTPAQQQLQQPGYIAQFDPYSSIGQGWDGSQQQQQQQPPPQQQQQSMYATPTPLANPAATYQGKAHPREYIRMNKMQIEAWSVPHWKELLSCLDTLKDAWSARKTEVDAKIPGLQHQLQYSAASYYGVQLQQEIGRLQQLSKDADSNAGSAAASAFQLKEVFESYRQSGDHTSKSMVRQASNAAVQSLPDWPQPY